MGAASGLFGEYGKDAIQSVYTYKNNYLKLELIFQKIRPLSYFKYFQLVSTPP